MDNTKHRLDITWAKAFGEVYVHHASLFIPMPSDSLFLPELACVGVTKRAKILLKKKMKDIDTRVANYLPASQTEGGILVKLNSSPIVEALGLNTWTFFKTGKRKQLKEFPVNVFYSIDGGEEKVLPFDFKELATPYLLSEHLFETLSDNEAVESKIEFKS